MIIEISMQIINSSFTFERMSFQEDHNFGEDPSLLNQIVRLYFQVIFQSFMTYEVLQLINE